MLNLTRPKYVFPFHGDHKRISLHAGLAEDVGVQPEHIFKGRNGLPLEITEDGREVRQGRQRGHDLRRRRRDRRPRRRRPARPPDALRRRHLHRRRHRLDRATGPRWPTPEIIFRGVPFLEDAEADALVDELCDVVERSLRQAAEQGRHRPDPARGGPPRRRRRVRLRAAAPPPDGAAGRRRGLSDVRWSAAPLLRWLRRGAEPLRGRSKMMSRRAGPLLGRSFGLALLAVTAAAASGAGAAKQADCPAPHSSSEPTPTSSPAARWPPATTRRSAGSPSSAPGAVVLDAPAAPAELLFDKSVQPGLRAPQGSVGIAGHAAVAAALAGHRRPVRRRHRRRLVIDATRGNQLAWEVSHCGPGPVGDWLVTVGAA